MSGELFEIFMPGARYLREEKERLELYIERPEDGAPPFGVDLDTGIVVIEAAPASCDKPGDDV